MRNKWRSQDSSSDEECLTNWNSGRLKETVEWGGVVSGSGSRGGDRCPSERTGADSRFSVAEGRQGLGEEGTAGLQWRDRLSTGQVWEDIVAAGPGEAAAAAAWRWEGAGAKVEGEKEASGRVRACSDGGRLVGSADRSSGGSTSRRKHWTEYLRKLSSVAVM